MNMPGLANWLMESDSPFVLVGHSHRPYALPAVEIRPRIRELFEKADKVCLVAADHVRAMGRFLGRDLRNALVVQNPVNLKEAGRVAPGDRSLQIGDRGEAAARDGEPQGGGCRTERSPSLQAGPLMACVARFEVRDKGQDLLLEALAAPIWRERDFRLNFYGSGPDREILEDLLSIYGLRDKVQIVGFESDIRKIWAGHGLLVLPSLSEGTPISLIEAQLCGRAALVTRVDGNPEWVEEGKTGFLAEAATVAHLREALERAWENRHRWREMGEAAQAACLAKRDPDPAGTLLALLRKAAERG
jgi:glycosyltransferase involved in cell wall biosynthesis